MLISSPRIQTSQGVTIHWKGHILQGHTPWKPCIPPTGHTTTRATPQKKDHNLQGPHSQECNTIKESNTPEGERQIQESSTLGQEVLG